MQCPLQLDRIPNDATGSKLFNQPVIIEFLEGKVITSFVVVVVALHVKVRVGCYLNVNVLFFIVVFGFQMLHLKGKPGFGCIRNDPSIQNKAYSSDNSCSDEVWDKHASKAYAGAEHRDHFSTARHSRADVYRSNKNCNGRQ